jgi:transposase
MSISELKAKPSTVEPVQRFEVFTGAGRRRTWSAEEKARIVAKSYDAGETVCSVARRHALTPQQLFTWRREARRRQEPGGTIARPCSSLPSWIRRRKRHRSPADVPGVRRLRQQRSSWRSMGCGCASGAVRRRERLPR